MWKNVRIQFNFSHPFSLFNSLKMFIVFVCTVCTLWQFQTKTHWKTISGNFNYWNSEKVAHKFKLCTIRLSFEMRYIFVGEEDDPCFPLFGLRIQNYLVRFDHVRSSKSENKQKFTPRKSGQMLSIIGPLQILQLD